MIKNAVRKTPLMKLKELEHKAPIEDLLQRNSVTGVAHSLGLDKGTVSKWRNRFGLEDRRETAVIGETGEVAASNDETLEGVVIRLSAVQIRQIDMVVAIGKFKNKSEAASWLVREGMDAKEDYLGKVEEAVKEIRALTETLRTL